MVKASAAMPNTHAPAMAVLAFQLAGWAYQPPAGDQTCLGYLRETDTVQVRETNTQLW